MALNSLICADVPLRIYSFTHACDASTLVDELFIHIMLTSPKTLG